MLTIRRPSSLPARRLYCVTVQPPPLPDVWSAQDHGTGLSTLFPGHIHFASLTRIHSNTCKGKDIVILLCPLFLVC